MKREVFFNAFSPYCSVDEYIFMSQYLHVFLSVNTAVGCQFVGLRQLSNSLLQVVHLGIHRIYGLNYGHNDLCF